MSSKMTPSGPGGDAASWNKTDNMARRYEQLNAALASPGASKIHYLRSLSGVPGQHSFNLALGYSTLSNSATATLHGGGISKGVRTARNERTRETALGGHHGRVSGGTRTDRPRNILRRGVSTAITTSDTMASPRQGKGRQGVGETQQKKRASLFIKNMVQRTPLSAFSLLLRPFAGPHTHTHTERARIRARETMAHGTW